MLTRKNLDFKHFEMILKRERKKVEKNLALMKEEVEVLAREDEIDDLADMAELQIDNTTDQSLLHLLEKEIFEIDAALGRIQDGTYGICEKTAKPIPIERLMANPAARTVVSK